MDNKRQSQKQNVLNWLRAGHTISDNDARGMWNITRLASIIHKLKGEGHNITMTWEKHKGGRHARYTYIFDDQGDIFV